MDSAPELGLAGIQLATSYRTGRSDPVRDFYRPCILKSERYDRAVGYFRSSVYLLVGSATVEFARRDGKIRLVCSVSLDDKDLTSIESGYVRRDEIVRRALDSEIDALLSNDHTEYRTRVLAALVASGALDIRIAIRPGEVGIYHEKIGIFQDNFDNTVSFIGSANETWSAWHERGNFESIEVFCSWKDERDRERVVRHHADFNSLWESRTPGVTVTPFPEASKRRLVEVQHPDLSEVDLDVLEGEFTRRTPQPHQLEAIAKWTAEGQRGILEHATGSGKTFTALTAMRPHIERGYPTLILVPSKLLLEQWAEEVRTEYPKAALLLAGAGNGKWRDGARLRSLTNPSPELGARVVLATMQTAATDEFRNQVWGGPHLMMVADEVHQIGSVFNSCTMLIASGPRLGLSATPSRYGDPTGTQNIVAYFGNVLQPPFTLHDAIAAGRLVEYEYHPRPITLTEEEADEWNAQTNRIRLEIARQAEDANGRKPLTERAKLLLIQRSRIAKKAFNKISLAREVLARAYESGSHWLVYCEDAEQLRDVMRELTSIGLKPVEYHSAMDGDRRATLNWFREVGGILVSIKCLDEGVDIPTVSHALILASSQNPRQFIQRRGRVLRVAPGKVTAVIYDAIVVPAPNEEEPDQASIWQGEVSRALEFARSAMNRSAGAELREIAIRRGLPIDESIDTGIEEEGE